MNPTSRDLARAEAFGRLAARTGQAVSSCPYEANGTAQERILAARFVRAYVKAGGQVPVDLDDGEGMRQGAPRYTTVQRGGKVIRVAILRRGQ